MHASLKTQNNRLDRWQVIYQVPIPSKRWRWHPSNSRTSTAFPFFSLKRVHHKCFVLMQWNIFKYPCFEWKYRSCIEFGTVGDNDGVAVVHCLHATPVDPTDPILWQMMTSRRNGNKRVSISPFTSKKVIQNQTLGSGSRAGKWIGTIKNWEPKTNDRWSCEGSIQEINRGMGRQCWDLIQDFQKTMGNALLWD